MLALGAAHAAHTPMPATPKEWPMYALNPGHNAYSASNFPAVSWRFQSPGAPETRANKMLNPTIIRDLVGFPIGVAVVDEVVYAPNDDGYLYALDARSGKLLWRYNAFNQLMSTPIIADVGGIKSVFVGGGNSDFSYTNAKQFGVKDAPVIRGTGVSAIFALDARTGKMRWVFPTQGEDMPTPAYYKGKLLFGNGDGHAYALDAATGKLLWKTEIKSFVSMSSATLDPERGVLVMGGTQPSKIYGLDAETGKLLWAVEPPNIFSSSAGDGTWAMHDGATIGQIETRSADQASAGTSSSEELAIDLKTGKILWSTTLGSGKSPPRNKDTVPTVVGDVVYTGSPVTHTEYALDASSGKILWQQPLKVGMKGAPTVVGDAVIQATASGEIFTLARSTGQVLHIYNAKQGGYGPQNGVVIGKTYFIGTNTGWLQAIPLHELVIKE
ncbi:MAG TPA: hypothetical protein DCQ77_09245 [Betaproteobacteria bacterium]|nr:hypothetical protein [Betaproteobacteria bacterium]